MDTSHFFDMRKVSGTRPLFANTVYAHPAEATEEGAGIREDDQEDTVSGGSPVTATQVARARGPIGSFSETLTSVTIKQILSAILLGNEPMKINNKVVKHITVVARVTRLDARGTRISLALDDCTAMIEAVYLTPLDEDMPPDDYVLQKRTRITEGLWIRVIGVLCLMDGETKVSIIRMRPVDDSNEVVFHRLDAIKTFLEQTKKDTRSTTLGT